MTSPSSDFEDAPVTLEPGDSWVIECQYGGPDHEFDYDWIFGGPMESDPRADPRWRPTTYVYFSDRLEAIHTTQTPLCDDQAIDEFTIVGQYGKDYNPKYLSVQRPGDGKPRMLPVEYDKATDTVEDK